MGFLKFFLTESKSFDSDEHKYMEIIEERKVA